MIENRIHLMATLQRSNLSRDTPDASQNQTRCISQYTLLKKTQSAKSMLCNSLPPTQLHILSFSTLSK